MIELRRGTAHLVLAPELGGAVASWDVAGIPVFHPVVDPMLGAQRGAALAAYPLVPFSNRVAWGRFSFEGHDHQLARNFGDHPHTIHGNAWMHPWEILAQDDAGARFAFAHDPARPGAAAEWPFAYRTTIAYLLAEDGLAVTLTVENTDTRRQPVGCGFHPYIPRAAGLRLGFTAASVWHVGACSLPDARLPATGEWSFDPPRDVGATAIDNCFNAWFGCASVEWPGLGRRLGICATPPFGHLVVFTPPGKPYVAVEPATNMTDAINRMDVPDAGLRVLDPGETLTGRVDCTLAGAESSG